MSGGGASVVRQGTTFQWVNDYVRIEGNPFRTFTTFTMSFWMKTTLGSTGIPIALIDGEAGTLMPLIFGIYLVNGKLVASKGDTDHPNSETESRSFRLGLTSVRK